MDRREFLVAAAVAAGMAAVTMSLIHSLLHFAQTTFAFFVWTSPMSCLGGSKILGGRPVSVEILVRVSERVDRLTIIFCSQSDQMCSSVMGFLAVPASPQNMQFLSFRRPLSRGVGLTRGMSVSPSGGEHRALAPAVRH